MNDAERLLSDLQSPHWWLTAVVLALVVNLASSYLKPIIDEWRDRRALRCQSLAERNATRTELWARFLLEDERLLIMATSRLQTLKIEMFAMSALLLVEAAWLFFYQVRPSSPLGWAGLVSFLVLVVLQAMEVLWHRQDIRKTNYELTTVQKLLEEQVMSSAKSAGSASSTDAA